MPCFIFYYKKAEAISNSKRADNIRPYGNL